MELSKTTMEKWRDLQRKYRDVIEIMSDNEKFMEVVSTMSDEEAAKLFKALLLMGTISGKLARWMELSEEDYEDVLEKIEEILGILKKKQSD